MASLGINGLGGPINTASAAIDDTTPANPQPTAETTAVSAASSPPVQADIFQPAPAATASAAGSPSSSATLPSLTPTQAEEIARELGPDTLVGLQKLIVTARSKGAGSSATFAAITELLNKKTSTNGEVLMNLVPFMATMNNFGEAFKGVDKNGQPLSGGQRAWSFLAGVVGGIIDASTFGAGNNVVSTVGKAAIVANVADGVQSAARWQPLLSELSKPEPDPMAVARLIGEMRKPTAVETAKDGLRSSIVGTQREPAPTNANLADVVINPVRLPEQPTSEVLPIEPLVDSAPEPGAVDGPAPNDPGSPS